MPEITSDELESFRTDGYSPIVTDDNAELPSKDIHVSTAVALTLEEVRNSSVEELLLKLESVLLQISSQGPSELKAPIDRHTPLISLGLDSMTIVQFKGVLENRYHPNTHVVLIIIYNKRYFCDVPDDFLFTQLATLSELAGIVKVGSLSNDQKHNFESLQTNKDVNNKDNSSTEVIHYKQPLCPWFTCCY